MSFLAKILILQTQTSKQEILNASKEMRIELAMFQNTNFESKILKSENCYEKILFVAERTMC